MKVRPEPMNHSPSFRLTKTNRLAILEYSALVDVTPAEFLNRFLDDFLVGPFTGAAQEFICQFSFRNRPTAERVVRWLHQSEKENGWNLERRYLKGPKGFRIGAARLKNGEMYRISLDRKVLY